MNTKNIVVILCVLSIAFCTYAKPAKKAEVAAKVEEVEEVDEVAGEDLVPEGSRLGFIGGGSDYEESHASEEGYQGKAGHENAHKKGGKLSHHDEHDQGGHKKLIDDQGAHSQHQKHGHEDYDTHQNSGGHHSFVKEGELFDKHGSEKKAKLEKGENVKAHEEATKVGGHGQAGGHAGGEVVKDKGHKHHGFKNVYHKEEYGEHKTFHDEQRETDHKKKYKDEHEDYSHNGAKQLKQHSNKGHYDDSKQGSDFHKFGKAGHESHKEGAHKKGGHHHKVDDGFKQQSGKHLEQAHAQGHYDHGKKQFHNGEHDVAQQQKAHHEAHHGHKQHHVQKPHHHRHIVHHGGDRLVQHYRQPRPVPVVYDHQGYDSGDFDDHGVGHRVYYRSG